MLRQNAISKTAPNLSLLIDKILACIPWDLFEPFWHAAMIGVSHDYCVLIVIG